MTATVTFDSIRKDIQKRNFAPIYLLMGEESYFIDILSDLLQDKVLSETEKDFNLQIFYGVDSDVKNIIAAARRYPMMSDYQLILLKEAQSLDKFEELDSYFKNPMKSTILVIGYKHGSVDKRKSLVKNIEKNGGVVFESKKLYENQVIPFINSYFSEKGIKIDAKSAQMIVDFVGNDLSRLATQLEKLEISMSRESRTINADLIEKNIGVSKEYNNFELQKAIVEKDFEKANKIVDYFDKNPKDNPIFFTLAVLFNYFNNLLECFWLPQKSEQNVMTALNLKSSFFARDYMVGLRNYNANKVLNIISDLRTYDAKLKGFDNVSATQGDLMKELVYRIMH